MGITVKLRADHDGLMQLGGDFRAMIAQPAAPAEIDLVNFRHAFSKQLLGHLTREDWLLYPSLLQASDRRIAETAQSFINEMGGLKAAYKDWSGRWPTKRVSQEWVGFVRETTDLLDTLSHRIERENTELYPLVEHDRLYGRPAALRYG